MRTLSALLLLLFSLCANGQLFHSPNWNTGGGLSFGTLNFQQNGAGGVAVPIRYDFLNVGKSSISLGTNLKIGSEDADGISFPIILILTLILDASNADASNFFNTINNNSGNKGSPYGVGLFSDFPLLLHYNFGLGTKKGDDNPFGFYVGGGMSYTITGYPLSATMQQSTGFFGWVANAGIRLPGGLDLGFSVTRPLNNPIGPINNPLLYQLTLCSFRDKH